MEFVMRRKVIALSDIGDFIKKRRAELPSASGAEQMTQKELGERLADFGIKARTNTTISDWETGRANVPLVVIPALAQALDVSPIRLYSLAGALKDVPAGALLQWVERQGLTDKQIRNAIQLLEVHFKKDD